MADLVETLLAKPGLYAGTQVDPSEEHPAGSVGRVRVTPLPGRMGVTFDYEVLNPERGLNHLERSMLAKTKSGLVLLVSHTHADVATLLREAGPGEFTVDESDTPFPMAIKLEVPEAGHLVYTWSYGWGDDPIRVRDIGDLRLVS
jgi:hypothetical protein